MRIFTKIVQTLFIIVGLVLTCFLALCWVKPEILVKAHQCIETNLLESGNYWVYLDSDRYYLACLLV